MVHIASTPVPIENQKYEPTVLSWRHAVPHSWIRTIVGCFLNRILCGDDVKNQTYLPHLFVHFVCLVFHDMTTTYIFLIVVGNDSR